MLSVYINEADEDLGNLKSELASEMKELKAANNDLKKLSNDPLKDEKAPFLKDLAAASSVNISVLKEQIEDLEKQKSILLQSVERAEIDLALAINHESMLYSNAYTH